MIMRLMRWVAGVLLCLLVLPPLPAIAADDDLEEALRDLPPRERTVYRRQLLQLERVARRLLQAIPNPPKVNFTLAAGEGSINAGTTFGRIVITEGMMRFVRSDDELAMILGHELAHLTQGHVSRGAVNNTLLGIGSIIAGTIVPGAGQATSLLGQLFLNHFNQDQEREADQVGLRYAYDAGYDPEAATRVMQRMAEEVPQTATAGFFSSHPSSVERAAELRHEAAQLGERREERHVVSEVPDRRPVPERDEEACQRARPYFYRARDAADLDEKVALYQRGLRLCPQSPRAHSELADAYADLGEEREAAEELREVLRYNPNYPDARSRLRKLEDRLSRVAD
ncbi:MAG: M48 family metalloprotease [Deltaproteobacteria bacterium]|nr:M48 family metalloprotease [Deltaproteobacteria bacterium]